MLDNLTNRPRAASARRAASRVAASVIWALTAANVASAQGAEIVEILTPPADTVQSGIIGLDLLRSEIAISTPGVRTTQTVQKRVFVDVYGAQAFEPLRPTSSKAKLKACAAGGLGNCLFDDDGDGRFDRIAKDDTTVAFKLDQPVPYERTNISDPASRTVRHLTLAAIQGRELTLRYHEEFARPGTFAADEVIRVTAPAELPAAITVREFTIRVLTLQDGKLTYSLVPPKPFRKAR